MKQKVVYVEDELETRRTFQRRIRRLYGNDYEVVAPELEPTLDEMIESLISIENVVSFIVDEDLKHTGDANYFGTELIERIRIFDSKVPIYILTSIADKVDPKLGDVEFVIDKVELDDEPYKLKVKSRMRRHVATYCDIVTVRSNKFEELLKKSLFSALSDEEEEEYNTLNVLRVKKILGSEGKVNVSSLELLKEKNKKLDELESELKGLLDE